MFLDIIFDASLTRADEYRRALRIIRRNQPQLACRIIPRRDDQIFARMRHPDARLKPVVILVVEDDVVALRRAKDMELDRIHPPVLIDDAVEQRAAIAAPDDIAERIGDDIAEHRAGFEIAEMDSEAFAAIIIKAVSKNAIIGRDVAAAQPVIILARCKRGNIKDQLIVTPCHGLAKPFAVLRADLKRFPIEPVAILLRHARIIFLHPRLHLGEQRINPLRVRRHHAFEIAIFSRQMAKYVWTIDLRIIGIAQPRIAIINRDAVVGKAVRAAVGNRGNGQIRHEYFQSGAHRQTVAFIAATRRLYRT